MAVIYILSYVTCIHIQHSWKWYLYNRCQNVNRPVCKEEVENGSGGSRKLLKLDTRNKHAYPCIPLFADDDASLGKHLDMLASEIAKPPSKQDPIILKELMKRTFSKRRNWVLRDLDEGEESVKQIIAKYPLLSKAAYVSSNKFVYQILTRIHECIFFTGISRVLSNSSKKCKG